MSVLSPSPTGRCFLTTLATAGVFGLALLASSSYAQTVPAADAQASLISPLPANLHAAIEGNAIRPFRITVPEAALVDLRRRIAATKWPERETVSDATQGVQLATMQKLAHYWVTDYDWRKVEARLNALPQFVANIDGLDIHFIHVRSKNAERWSGRNTRNVDAAHARR
jgi:hypothetical protein